MNLYKLTYEEIEILKEKLNIKQVIHDTLLAKTGNDLWIEDINEFQKEWKKDLSRYNKEHKEPDTGSKTLKFKKTKSKTKK